LPVCAIVHLIEFVDLGVYIEGLEELLSISAGKSRGGKDEVSKFGEVRWRRSGQYREREDVLTSKGSRLSRGQ
jgi:hypothetical protein